MHTHLHHSTAPPSSSACAISTHTHPYRLLASKAAQALFLLRTLTAANVNRLALRLADDTRRQLQDLVRVGIGAGLLGAGDGRARVGAVHQEHFWAPLIMAAG